MTAKDASSAGKSANRRGLDWQRRGAAWLRETGLYPAAESVGQLTFGRSTRGGQGDLRHVGDRIIEMTIEPWDKLLGKLRQAEDDAAGAAARLPGASPDPYFVWKPVPRERAGTARSLIITRAEVAWPLLARLDKLETAELEAAGQYDRGYAAGWQAALDSAAAENIREVT
jgi:hypothetical protein